MTGMDLHKLRREPLELGTGLYESAHANLT